MAKTESPSFVLSLELASNPRMVAVLSNELEICRIMYNTILGQYLKREKQMKREKEYKKLIRQLNGVTKKLTKDEHNVFQIQEKKTINHKLKQLREKYQLTEYASHQWVKPIRKHFQNKVNAAVAQKIASRAWLTFCDKLFGKAKKVNFLRKGERKSLEGKTNKTGWRYVDRFIVYQDLTTPLIIKKNDSYASEVIHHLERKTPFSYMTVSNGEKKTVQDVYRVKFVRMIKKEIRGKERFFADLVISGYPPSKNRKLGTGDVGLDIGTSSLAVSSLTKVALFNLAEQVKQTSHAIRLIQRKMDRSKRATNPQNFNPDGTIKKGKKSWVFSNHYQKYRTELKELYRKQAVIRKLSHRTLANELLPLGDHFYTETMNFKALQKRKKETEISMKSGKYIRKKRFGKTLGNRAPAMFITILGEKVKRLGGTFVQVRTQKFKASQYCHVKNDYRKKPLSQRWHVIDEHTTMQRDLYAAFLLMNSNKSGTRSNRKKCKETFSLFKNLHDQEVQTILKEKRKILNSGIIFKNV